MREDFIEECLRWLKKDLDRFSTQDEFNTIKIRCNLFNDETIQPDTLINKEISNLQTTIWEIFYNLFFNGEFLSSQELDSIIDTLHISYPYHFKYKLYNDYFSLTIYKIGALQKFGKKIKDFFAPKNPNISKW